MSTSVQATEPDVGRRLRELRQRRGLTQRALAQACDLSTNAIGLIERGESSPSVSTLNRLAQALQTPIAELFIETSEQRVVFTKGDQRSQAHRDQIQMENLAEGLSGQCMEAFLVTLQPGAGTGAEPVIHMGEEFVFCMEGQIEYRISDQAYYLEAGDSLMFQADQPHCWCNLAEEPARLLLIFHAVDEPQKWWQQHLNQLS